MVKKLTAATAAQQVTQALQPVANFRVTDADLKQPAPPRQNPMPAPLSKALGQS
jgi:hypothetical protein